MQHSKVYLHIEWSFNIRCSGSTCCLEKCHIYLITKWFTKWVEPLSESIQEVTQDHSLSMSGVTQTYILHTMEAILTVIGQNLVISIVQLSYLLKHGNLYVKQALQKAKLYFFFFINGKRGPKLACCKRVVTLPSPPSGHQLACLSHFISCAWQCQKLCLPILQDTGLILEPMLCSHQTFINWSMTQLCLEASFCCQ